MKPVRLTLSRQRGFNLQELSLSTNGLPAVNCARPHRWGNPFKVHHPTGNPSVVIEDAIHGVCFSNEAACKRFQAMLYAGVTPGWNLADMREHLRGKNLACFCKADEKFCHVDILLTLANA